MEGLETWTGGCPWVRVEDLNHGEVKETARTLSQEGMEQVRISPEDTVFFSSTGTIGKVGIAAVPMAPSNNLFAVEFDAEKVLPRYGMYCFLAMEETFQAEAGGAVYTSLRLSVFRKIRIPVPDLSVQRKIMDKLALLQESEWQQKRLAGEIRQAVHSRFDQYFCGITEAVMQEKHCLRLGDCADILLNGAAKTREEQGAAVFYVATSQLQDWEIQKEQVPEVDAKPEKLASYSLHAGDIVMNRVNSAERLGRCGILLTEPEKQFVFGQNTLRIRIKKQTLNPLFLFAWLTHPYIKHYIQGNAKNSTSFQSSLTKSVLEQIPIPEIDLLRQETYAEELNQYVLYVRNAEEIITTLQELQQVWYDRIRLLQQKGEEEESLTTDQKNYQEGRYWITPSGCPCFYDSWLECIQIPKKERRSIRLSHLPLGAEMQFLDPVRTADQKDYGCMDHIRLKRVKENTVQLIRMQPVAYRSGKNKEEEDFERQLEEYGILSEQQDFGYIRRIQEVKTEQDMSVDQLFADYMSDHENGYSRFKSLPDAARSFVSRLSPFQQAVFEEFLLAMQPLACHMVGKQVGMRSEKDFRGRGIQDVIATVRLLEHAGLLEKRQGLYLHYDGDYKQGEKREQILDHRGNPIPVDTWICAEVKE